MILVKGGLKLESEKSHVLLVQDWTTIIDVYIDPILLNKPNMVMFFDATQLSCSHPKPGDTKFKIPVATTLAKDKSLSVYSRF